MRSRLGVFPSVVLLVAAAWPSTATADDKGRLTAASDAFERGITAQQQGDHRRAAAEFAHADLLVPEPSALEAALKESVLADDPVLGMKLVDRAGRRAPDASVGAAADAARTKFASRAGRVSIHCASCVATLDGATVATDTPQWVAPGDHAVQIELEGRSERKSVHVDGGGSVDVAPSAPAPIERREPPAGAAVSPSRGGISPAWFWVGLGLTTIAGGVTIASAAHTANLHDAFEKDQSRPNGDAGAASQNVTNALALTTGVLILGTAALGLFAVRWKDGAAKVALVPSF